MRHGPALFLFFTLLSISVFAADPYVGPEQAVTPVSPGAVVGGKLKSIALTDGTNFLVVWADRRNGHLSVYGMRVSASGEELDDPPLLLLDNGQDGVWWGDAMSRVTALWDGSAYVISRIEDTRGQMIRVRVSPEGTVSREETAYDPPPVYPHNALGETLEVDSDNGGTDVFFVNSGGLWTDLVQFEGEYLWAATPLDDGDWGFVLGGRYGIRWVRANRHGVVTYKRLMNRDHDGYGTIKVATKGTSVAVLFIGYQQVGWNANMTARIYHRTTSWLTFGSAGKVKEGSLADEDVEFPVTTQRVLQEGSVSVNGDDFHFAYSRGDSPARLHAFRTRGEDAEEVLIDGPSPQPVSEYYSPSLASSATHTMLAWLQPCSADSACNVAIRLFPNGGSAEDAPTRWIGARTILAQKSPSAASTATTQVTAWRDSGRTVSFRARVAPFNGSPPRVVTAGEVPYGSCDVIGPRVAATTGGFALVWVETERKAGTETWYPGWSQVKLRRFTAQGEPIDPAPVRISLENAVKAIDIAPRGDGFEVTWVSPDVIAIRYLPISGAPGRQWRLAPTHPTMQRFEVDATQTGDGITVTWTEVVGDSSRLDMVGVSVDPSGEVGTPLKLGDARVDRTFGVAANDHEIVIVTIPEARETGCVQADRFTIGLVPIRPTIETFCREIATATGATPFWDGRRWWIALSSSNEGLRAATFDGNWIADGIVSLATDTLGRPAFARTPAGTVVAYERRMPAQELVGRVFLRTISSYQRGRAVRH
jgi:hypothetical protein